MAEQRGPLGTERWLAPAVAAGALCLTTAQAAAYFARLDLSLGPRVIFQPWLVERGFVMYEQLADLHSPLMPLLLAALRPLVPDGLLLAKCALIALLSLTTLLACVATWRAAGGRAGALAGLGAAAFCVAWSRSFGFGKLWHESFLAPLVALLLLLPPPLLAGAREYRRWRGAWLPVVLVGLLCGVALLVKQYAVVLAGLAALAAALPLHPWRAALARVALLAAAAALPVLAFALYQYLRAGTLAGTFYWIVLYAFTSGYRGETAQAPTPAQFAILAQAGVLLPAAVAALLAARRQGAPLWRRLAWALALLGAASVPAYPRFELFHLQAALPALAFISALTLVVAWRACRAARGFVIGVVVGVALLAGAVALRPVQLALDPEHPQHINEYSDLVPLAETLRAHLSTGERIYLFPDDEATSNLYYLLGKEPPCFWIFHYPWYMLGPIQARIVATLEAAPPEWVVYFPNRWGEPASTPQVTSYIQAHYELAETLRWADGEVRLLRRAR